MKWLVSWLFIGLMLFGLCCTTVSQSLLWEDQLNLTGQADQARGIAVSDNHAIVVGQGQTLTGVDMVVRAYAIKTGQLAWQDQVQLAGTTAGIAITQADGKVFCSGYAPASVGTDFLTVAYDVATGNKLWTDVADKGRDDFVQDMVAGPNGVYMVGYGGNVNNSPLDGIIRAYNQDTGTLLWEDQVDNGGDDAAWRVTVSGGLVIVALSSRPVPTDPWAMLIRAYNETTGTLAWQSVHPLAQPLSLATDDNNLYVGGVNVLSAYSVNGTPLWSKPLSESIGDIALVNQFIITVGANLTAYDLDGNMLWGIPSDGGRAISVLGDTLYLIGNTESPSSSELIVRAYNATTGVLLWTDTSHTSSETVASDIIATKHGLIAVGWTTNSVGNTDFLVRAYSVPKKLLARDKIRRSIGKGLWYSRLQN